MERLTAPLTLCTSLHWWIKGSWLLEVVSCDGLMVYLTSKVKSCLHTGCMLRTWRLIRKISLPKMYKMKKIFAEKKERKQNIYSRSEYHKAFDKFIYIERNTNIYETNSFLCYLKEFRWVLAAIVLGCSRPVLLIYTSVNEECQVSLKDCHISFGIPKDVSSMNILKEQPWKYSRILA